MQEWILRVLDQEGELNTFNKSWIYWYKCLTWDYGLNVLVCTAGYDYSLLSCLSEIEIQWWASSLLCYKGRNQKAYGRCWKRVITDNLHTHPPTIFPKGGPRGLSFPYNVGEFISGGSSSIPEKPCGGSPLSVTYEDGRFHHWDWLLESTGDDGIPEEQRPSAST